MNLGRRLLAATALMLCFGSSLAADDLSQILATMDRRIAIHCEYRHLLSKMQRTRDPDERRALQQEITNLDTRADDMDRFEEINLDSKARALPKSDQVKLRLHVNSLVERCNANLPPEARISHP